MKKSKNIPDDAEFPITKTIRDGIFNIPLLHQDEVVPIFIKLDQILNRQLGILCRGVPRIRAYYQEIIERIGSGNTQGKSLYDKKDGEDGKSKAKKVVILQPSEFRILCMGIPLLRSDLPPDMFAKTVLEIKFLRGVGEEAIELFNEITKDFEENYKQYLKFKRRSSINYLEYEAKIKETYEVLGINDPAQILTLIGSTTRTWAKYVEIRGQIIEPYLRMVYKQAKNFSSSDTQTLDNFQAGVFGLMRAIKHYTVGRFAFFSIVAEQWVRQAILHYLRTDVNFIRLPMANWHFLQKIDKAKEKIEHNRSREATAEEISAEIQLPLEKVKKIMSNAQLVKVFSLSTPTQNEEDQNAEGTYSADSLQADSTPEEMLMNVGNTRILESVTQLFDLEEKTIFGLISGCHEVIPDLEFTQVEILSEQVRQAAAKYGLALSFK